METKTQSLVIKILTGLIIFLGVIFTIWVMGDDNPKELSYDQQRQWAINEAIDQGLADEMDQMQLNSFLSEKTAEIAQEKEETLWSDVSKLINFSSFLIIFGGVLVLGAFIYLIIIDTNKALKILAGVGIFSLFIFIVKLVSSVDGGSDMDLASTAINATIILTLVAISGVLHGASILGKILLIILLSFISYSSVASLLINFEALPLLFLIPSLLMIAYEFYIFYLYFKKPDSLN
jgi:hypothetical protein